MIEIGEGREGKERNGSGVRRKEGKRENRALIVTTIYYFTGTKEGKPTIRSAQAAKC